MHWEVSVTQEQSGSLLDQDLLAELVDAVLVKVATQLLPPEIVEVSILITDDQEIAELNSTYRGKPQATDVLSFSQLEGSEFFPGAVQLGDIVISLETATRQAIELNTSLAEELLRLLIHGLLHLCGYDHENVPQTEVERMQVTEDELLTEMLPRVTHLVLV